MTQQEIKNLLAPRTISRGPFGRPVVATRSNVGQKGGFFSNGTTDLSATFRKHHFITTDCYDIQLVYCNAYDEIDGFSPIDVKATVEDSAGNFIVLKFNGKKTVTIDPGAFVISDPIAFDMVKGDEIWTRTYVSVTSGNKWPLNDASFADVSGEGAAANVDYTTTSGTFSQPGYLFVPLLLIGRPKEQSPITILGIGDSLMAGGSGAGRSECLLQTFGTNYFQNYNVINMGVPGDAASAFLPINNRRKRMVLMAPATHALCNFGINDVTTDKTLTQLQTGLLAVWNMLAGLGMKVFHTTITPRTSSTDTWATTTNQTQNTSGQNTIRTQLNDWIRTTPAPLTGYFEVADAVETARNSGIWKAAYTADGIHPSSTAYAAAATVITPSSFI